MRLNEPLDPSITWAIVAKYWAKTPRREGVVIINTFIQEAEQYRSQYSWLMLLLWCAARTEYFTDACYIDNFDVGRLGGKYQTSREGIREAAKEFAKFSDTNMLDEEEEMLKEFADILKFAKGENPNGEQPVTEPVKPIPLPPAPVDPVPPPSKPDTSPSPWKKKFAWVGTLVSVLLGCWFIIGKFFPGAWGNVVRLILEALAALF